MVAMRVFRCSVMIIAVGPLASAAVSYCEAFLLFGVGF